MLREGYGWLTCAVAWVVGAVPFVTIAKLAIQRPQRSKLPVGDTYNGGFQVSSGALSLVVEIGESSSSWQSICQYRFSNWLKQPHGRGKKKRLFFPPGGPSPPCKKWDPQLGPRRKGIFNFLVQWQARKIPSTVGSPQMLQN